MEPKEWVAGNSFRDQRRVTPVRVFLVWKIGVSELSLLGFVHDVLLVAVDANVVEFTLRPPDGFSMQFLESSLLHSIADNGYPCGLPACYFMEPGDREDEILVRV